MSGAGPSGVGGLAAAAPPLAAGGAGLAGGGGGGGVAPVGVLRAGHNLNEDANSQQSCLTKIQPIVLSQRWRVENFGSVMKLSKPGQCLRSQAFKHSKFPQACWQLCLYPGGKRDENQGFVSLFLKMSAIHPAGEVYQKAEYLFYFIDDEGVPRFSNVNIGEFHAKPPKGGHSWGLRNIPRNKILNSLQSDGSLVILCEVELLPDIKFVRATEDLGGPPKAAPPATDVPKQFQANTERMFSEAAFTDYVVWAADEVAGARESGGVCEIGASSDFGRGFVATPESGPDEEEAATASRERPGREFRVHRAVLAAQSEVFRAMLEHGELAESKSGRLVVEDFGANAVEVFLRFLYTGRVAQEAMEEAAEEVLGLAEKYAVGDLKGLAQDHLLKRLSPANVCQMVVLADLHSAPLLLNASHTLIRAQRREILASPAWRQLKLRDARLTTDILERLCDSRDAATPSPPTKKARQA